MIAPWSLHLRPEFGFFQAGTDHYCTLSLDERHSEPWRAAGETKYPLFKMARLAINAALGFAMDLLSTSLLAKPADRSPGHLPMRPAGRLYARCAL
jgi:hypothetical protein